MCFQQWCFVESDGKVHRSPENVKPPKVKPVAATLAKVTLGTKLPNVKFNRDGVRADEKVLEWIKSRKEPVSPDEIRKKLTDYSHGSIRNALVRLHKAKKIKSPKFGYWVVA
jgi:hypothetical protein